jgi:shikimate kinase
MNVILVGFMATGKSTIGRALARKMGVPFVDMDREISRHFGTAIAEVFVQHGEPAFRKAETDLLTTLLAEQDLSVDEERRYPRRYVLSTGGGTPLREENQPLLKRLGHVVWLRARPETIADRCRPHLAKRPMLAGHEDALEERIGELLAHREQFYKLVSDSSSWTDDMRSADVIARHIRSHVEQSRG